MTDSSNNPYQAPSESIRENAVKSEPMERSFLANWMRWTLICLIVAIPSCLLAALDVGSFSLVVMVIGVLGFSLAYASLSRHPTWRRMMSDANFRYAVKLTIALRIFASIVLPLGMVNDLVIGIQSMHVAEMLTGEHMGPERMAVDAPPPAPTSPIAVLVATTIQGVLLTLELCVVFSVIYGLMQLLPHDSNNVSAAQRSG